MDSIIHLQDKVSLLEGDVKDIISLKRCFAEIKTDQKPRKKYKAEPIKKKFL